MNRPTIMKTTAFRQHLLDGKRFYEGYIYQTNRKTYMVYTPEYRVWIDKKGKCYTFGLTDVPKVHQNPLGKKITPTPVKPPEHVDILKLRERIMRDLNLKDLPSDREKPGPRSKLNGVVPAEPKQPREPKEVIEAIHLAAVRSSDGRKGPQVVETSQWPAEPPQDPAVEPPALAPAEGYENTQDYDVLKLLTDLWSRCGGSQEDLEWARTRFTEIGFLLPEVETSLTIVRPGHVTMDELVADLEAAGYKVRA
jgi:hypothetical protein